MRWYLRFGLSYRDVEELLGERGVEVDHVTVYRWVQRFTPLLVDAARPCRHSVGDRWYVDETYVRVAGRWRYVYRAVEQHGQIIDVYVSPRRDTDAARRFFNKALSAHGEPAEVVTDRAWALLAAVVELVPGAFHHTEQYANNRIEGDHGRLKARLRPMRGLKRDCTARVIMLGHTFMQNLRRSELVAHPSSQRRRRADRILVEALAAGATFEEAAGLAGVSAKTVSRRVKHDPEFVGEVDRLQGQSVEAIARELRGMALGSVSVLAELQVSAVKDADRIAAARTILDQTGRFQERVEDAAVVPPRSRRHAWRPVLGRFGHAASPSSRPG